MFLSPPVGRFSFFFSRVFPQIGLAERGAIPHAIASAIADRDRTGTRSRTGEESLLDRPHPTSLPGDSMSVSVPTPSGGRGQSVSILKLAPNKTRVVLFLGPLRGSRQHWSRNRTVPCLGDSPACQHHKDPLRFFAYAPVQAYESATGLWAPYVLQCTSNLEQQLRGRVIRGEVWALTREQHEHNRGAITGKYLQTQPLDTLSEPFDVVPTLLNAFGCTFIPLDTDNPFPDKLVLPAVALDLETPQPLASQTKPPSPDKTVLSKFLEHLKNKEKGEQK